MAAAVALAVAVAVGGVATDCAAIKAAGEKFEGLLGIVLILGDRTTLGKAPEEVSDSVCVRARASGRWGSDEYTRTVQPHAHTHARTRITPRPLHLRILTR